MKEIFTKTGESLAFYIFSLINAVVYAVWTVIYFVCLVMRGVAIDQACGNMLMSGYQEFTVEVSSPVFGVLEMFATALPVFLIVWMAMYFINNRKNKELCDNRLIAGAFIIDVISTFVIAIDVFGLHMVMVK